MKEKQCSPRDTSVSNARSQTGVVPCGICESVNLQGNHPGLQRKTAVNDSVNHLRILRMLPRMRARLWLLRRG